MERIASLCCLIFIINYNVKFEEVIEISLFHLWTPLICVRTTWCAHVTDAFTGSLWEPKLVSVSIYSSSLLCLTYGQSHVFDRTFNTCVLWTDTDNDNCQNQSPLTQGRHWCSVHKGIIEMCLQGQILMMPPIELFPPRKMPTRDFSSMMSQYTCIAVASDLWSKGGVAWVVTYALFVVDRWTTTTLAY